MPKFSITGFQDVRVEPQGPRIPKGFQVSKVAWFQGSSVPGFRCVPLWWGFCKNQRTTPRPRDWNPTVTAVAWLVKIVIACLFTSSFVGKNPVFVVEIPFLLICARIHMFDLLKLHLLVKLLFLPVNFPILLPGNIHWWLGQIGMCQVIPFLPSASETSSSVVVSDSDWAWKGLKRSQGFGYQETWLNHWLPGW